MSQEGLGPLFPGAVTEWTASQEALAGWLRYYDSFYEKCAYQMQVCDAEIVKAEMVVIDLVVDCFMVWYSWKSEQKKHERRDPSEPHEARAPRASHHETVYRIAAQ